MHTRSLLLIDDEIDYCLELKKALNKVGFQTSSANSINQALIEITKRKFDLLLIDKMLKDDFDGICLAEALSIIRPDIKTILMSGFLSQETRDKASSSIAYGFIEKPFSVAKLASLLENASINRSHYIWKDSYKVAFASIEDNGELQTLNTWARELLDSEITNCSKSAINFLFSESRTTLLNLAKKQWINLEDKFRITARKLEKNCDIICILTNEQHALINCTQIELIFGKRTILNLSNSETLSLLEAI